MDFQTRFSRVSIFILLFALLSFACSTPSWVPFIKKGPPHQAKTKELLDKEVVIIDREEYVKVANPKAREAIGEPKYLYIPVNEYLSNKEAYTYPCRVCKFAPTGRFAAVDVFRIHHGNGNYLGYCVEATVATEEEGRRGLF